MQFYILLIAALIAHGISLAQFGPQQVISTSTNGPIRSIAYDLNLDGDVDVISCSGNKIVWYENADGLGNFDSEEIINNNILAIMTLELVDLDTDGDMDFLYSTNLDKIAWLENLDGYGTFGEEQIIADIDYPYTLSVADIDDDGDMDIFANLYYNGFENRLVWYENMDGVGNFGSENLIEIGDFYVSTLVNFDLDNDGDMDLITSYESYSPSELIWYENTDSLGTFSESQAIYQFDYFSDWVSIYNLSSGDINSDGKIDLLVETYHDDFYSNIYWLENIDAQGEFSDPKNIHINETTLGSLRTFDLDNDNDLDILVTFYFGANSSVSWFRNLDGQGTFEARRYISTEVMRALDAAAADINGDGLTDVISASYLDDKIAWYENSGILGVPENQENRFALYPNPTSGLLHLQENEKIESIAIVDALGHIIEIKPVANRIDLSELASGIYFLKITDTQGLAETHKIIKN